MLLADGVDHPRQREPLSFSSHDVSSLEKDQKLLSPVKNLLCQIAHYSRGCVSCFFAFATAPLMLPTFPPSLSISLLAMSLCCLHTHMLKFSILETSMYTTLTGSNPPTLMLGELRRFISLFLTNWNKLSNILHVFLIVMTMQQTLLTYSLHLTLRTILTLFPLLWDPLTIVLFQLL